MIECCCFCFVCFFGGNATSKATFYHLDASMWGKGGKSQKGKYHKNQDNRARFRTGRDDVVWDGEEGKKRASQHGGARRSTSCLSTQPAWRIEAHSHSHKQTTTKKDATLG